jgi:hypothetical protein
MLDTGRLVQRIYRDFTLRLADLHLTLLRFRVLGGCGLSVSKTSGGVCRRHHLYRRVATFGAK